MARPWKPQALEHEDWGIEGLVLNARHREQQALDHDDWVSLGPCAKSGALGATGIRAQRLSELRANSGSRRHQSTADG